MKKLLALLLVVAMVCGAFVPAFAATDAELAAEAKLAELGVLNDDRADDNLTRAEMIVLLSRLLGEEAAAEDFPVAPSFEDAADHWGANYVAWAESLAYVNGYEDGTFRPDGMVTPQEYQAVLLRALGYEVAWADVPAKAEELGLVATVADATAIKRGETSVMTVAALDVEMADGSQTLAAKLGMVADLAIVSAEQTNTDEFTVTFNQAVTEGTFSVMRGKVATAVEEVEFDGATATLTMEREIRDGFDYTIAFGELEAVVAGEESVVSSISFPYDYANMVSFAEAETIVVYYDVEDQFGNDVTEDVDVTFYSVGLSGEIQKDGDIHITTDNAWLIGTPVVVNGVYNDGSGVVVTAVKTFEIAGPIKLAELALGEPVNLGEKANDIMKGQTFGDDDEDDYYWVLPVTALNQYGDQVPASYFDGVDSNDDGKIDTDYFTESGVEIDDAKPVVEYKDALYVVLDGYEDADNENTTAFVTVIDLNSGLNDSETFVVPKEGVYEFRAIGPVDEVIGNETVEVEFEAYDYYGNEITDEADLADVKVGSLNVDDMDTTAVIPEDDAWTFVTDAFTDEISLEYKADSNTSTYATPVFFTFTVENTASVSQLNFSISEDRRPIDIQGFDGDEDLVYASGAVGSIKVSDLIFIDQYGEEMSLEDIEAAGYYAAVEVADEATTGTVTVADGGDVDNDTIADTNLVAYLFEDGVTDTAKATGEYEFTVEVIEVADIDEFVLAEIPVMYAGASPASTIATKYTVALDLTGEYNGKTVVLPENTVIDIETYPDTYLKDMELVYPGVVDFEDVLGACLLPDDEDEDTTAVALVQYVINGNEANGIFERTVELSGVAPAAETLEVVLNDDITIEGFDAQMSGNAVELAISEDYIGPYNYTLGVVADDDQDEPAVFYFEATDQYGVVTNTDDVYSYFYLVEDDVKHLDTYNVNQAGEITANMNNVTDGDTFKVTAVTTSGLTQTIEVEISITDALVK